MARIELNILRKEFGETTAVSPRFRNLPGFHYEFVKNSFNSDVVAMLQPVRACFQSMDAVGNQI
jgi:hypothetical protein